MVGKSPFSRRNRALRPSNEDLRSTPQPDSEGLPPPTTQNGEKKSSRAERMLPNGGVAPAGESGRRGFHPWHFARIAARSASRASLLCSFLWPFVPAALAVRYALPEHHKATFALAYIAMVPCANLIGFAGQELSRKLPHVAGIILEIVLSGITEIILFQILLSKNAFEVIQDAVIGSLLASILMSQGLCFFVGGVLREEQTFDNVVSEVGSGMLLIAGVALSIPSIFGFSLSSRTLSTEVLDEKALQISRIISILLIISYATYLFFMSQSHHSIYTTIFERDEHRDRDKEDDLAKDKLTMTECFIALAIGIALVTIIAYTLVTQIEHLESPNVLFIGVILIPVIEKTSESLVAIDCAFDNQLDSALSIVLGGTLQTALFNAPLTVIVGWGLGKHMDLNFEIFNVIILILSILTAGRFLQDNKSNYLEGFLLIIVYVAFAVSAWYFPNPDEGVEEAE